MPGGGISPESIPQLPGSVTSSRAPRRALGRSGHHRASVSPSLLYKAELPPLQALALGVSGGGDSVCASVPSPGACSHSSASASRGSTPWRTTASAWMWCWWTSTTGATRAASGCSAAKPRATCQVRPPVPFLILLAMPGLGGNPILAVPPLQETASTCTPTRPTREPTGCGRRFPLGS